MDPQKIFFDNYDEITPLIFRPYERFLDRVAREIPRDVKKINDLASGTANLSLKIKKRLPHVKINCYDFSSQMIETARAKVEKMGLNGISFFESDVLDIGIPEADYNVTSLFTHHIDPPEIRQEKLLKMVSTSRRGFINFDMQLLSRQTQDDAIDIIINYARQNSDYVIFDILKQEMSEDDYCEIIRQEMKKNDNLMPLAQTSKIFSDEGFRFQVLAAENPFYVYKATHLNKKS